MQNQYFAYLTLAAMSIVGCSDKDDVPREINAEQLAYALGGEQYSIIVPEGYDKERDLLGFTLVFSDGTKKFLAGFTDLTPGQQVTALCLPDGEYRWTFSIFSEGITGKVPISLPEQYRRYVVSTFLVPSHSLSVGDTLLDFASDERAENGSFPNGEDAKIILSVTPRDSEEETSEQVAAPNP